MVKTIYVTSEVKEFMENFIRKDNPQYEKGGFLLGKNYQCIIPKFFPNMSNRPSNEYQIPSGYRHFLNLDKNIFNMDWEIFFHTHPNHSIPSQKDIERRNFFTPIELLIMFNENNDSFTWRSFDQQGIEHYVDIVSKEYDIFKKFFATSLHLINIGNSFITPNYELLCDNELGNVFLILDTDTIKVYQFCKEHKKYSYLTPSKKKMQEKIGISLGRINKSLEKLKKFKLIK